MEKNTYLDDLTPYFMGLMPLETLEWYINKFPEHEGLKKHWKIRFKKDFPNK